MTQFHAVAYVSSATPELASSADMDALLLDARAFNRTCGVTGVLLHQSGNLLQYIEGPVDGVMAVYGRILKSRRHTGVIELLNQPIPQRFFQDWTMGFAEPVLSELQSLSQASWLRQLSDMATQRDTSVGMDLLLDFWERAHGRP